MTAARLLTITQGNLNNGHIYLTGNLDLFPDDVMGGENSSHAAKRTVRVHYGSDVVETDIDRTKNLFRVRRGLRRFFREQRIAAGDRVRLEQINLYTYIIC